MANFSACPNCGSQNVTPINIEESVYECLTCNRRHHASIPGLDVGDMAYVVSDMMPGLDPELHAYLKSRAK